MTPELFATLLRPKLVNGVDTVSVAHNATTLTSHIDGTDWDGAGAGWTMDESYEDLRLALANLEVIMSKMGWRIEAEGWRGPIDLQGNSDDEMYVADFVRIPEGPTGSHVHGSKVTP